MYLQSTVQLKLRCRTYLPQQFLCIPNRSYSSFRPPLLPSSLRTCSLFWTGSEVWSPAQLCILLLYRLHRYCIYTLLYRYLQSTVQLKLRCRTCLTQQLLCILSRSYSSFRLPLLPSNLQTCSRSLSGSEVWSTAQLCILLLYRLHRYCIYTLLYRYLQSTVQ